MLLHWKIFLFHVFQVHRNSQSKQITWYKRDPKRTEMFFYFFYFRKIERKTYFCQVPLNDLRVILAQESVEFWEVVLTKLKHHPKWTPSKEMTNSFLALLCHPSLQIVNKNGFKMASERPRLEDRCRNAFIQYISTSPSFPLLFSFTLTSPSYPHILPAVMVTSLECLVVPKSLRIHTGSEEAATRHVNKGGKKKKWATWR